MLNATQYLSNVIRATARRVSKSSQAQKQANRRPQPRMSVPFEVLEGRQLMSVSLTSGVLSITGTDSPDTIVVAKSGASTTVTVNGTQTAYDTAISQIFIDAMAGDDNVSLTSDVLVPATILGGRGTDRINGGSGNDAIDGGDDSDYIYGNDGDDTLNGGFGGDGDLVSGGRGMDIIHGGDGSDQLDGGDDSDRIYGDDGNDEINGGFGGDGDWIDGGNGMDTIHGGDGNDYIDGGNDSDFLYGDDGMDEIHGGHGGDGDLIFGGSGEDHLFGGDGNDTIDGGDSSDWIYGEAGTDTLWGGFGGDGDLLDGGAGNDTLHGGDGNDHLIGVSGEDVLYSEAGNDTLDVTFDLGSLVKNHGRSVAVDSANDTLNLKLDVSSYLSTGIRPILSNIQKVTKSFQPIVSLYNKNIPIINKSFGSVLDTDGTFGVFVKAINTVNSFSTAGLTGTINLGSFTISNSGTDVLDTGVTNPLNGTLLGNAVAKLNAVGLQFPVLQNPSRLAALTLGNTSTNLVTFDLPTVSLSKTVEGPKIRFSLGPIPMSAQFFGSATFSVGGMIGFDASGIVTGKFQDGFFVSSSTGASLSLSVGGKAGVDIWFASAGVSGSVTGTLTATLKDPNGDGKVRFNELGSGFNYSKAIGYNVSVYGSLFGFHGSKTIASGTFAL